MPSASSYSTRFISRHPETLVFIISLGVSFLSSAFMLAGDSNSLIYYGDAVSHLVIAKRIIDSVTPGIAQLGSIWLPMTHLMLMPFTANNFLFQTGLAGTIVSGLSTAVSAAFLFRITKLHFGSNYAGYLACSLFLMNTSVIYMSIIPMMEAPFMMFFMMASYYGLRWFHLHSTGNDLWLQYRSLLKCSIAISGATLTRYEAWFFPIGLILLILIILLLGKKELWKRKIEAFAFIAVPYSLLGIIVWVVYNGLIFRNPLLFLTGPYSAQAQSLTRPYRQYLYMQPMIALSTIFQVATDMYGLHIVLLSFLGMGIFLYMKRKKLLLFSLVTILMLAFPILLDFVSMVQGSGEIYKHVSTGWFNGRYLIFVAPLFAFSCTAIVAFAATRQKKILTGTVALFVLSFYALSIFIHPLQVGSTTALSDGTILPYRGDTVYAIETGKALKELYDGGRVLDFTLSKSSPIIQLYSGIQLKDFVDINSRDYWTDSTLEPWTHADYLIMEKRTQTYEYDPTSRVISNWTRDFDSLTSPWQPVGESLLSSISVIYENPDFVILKNDQKDLVLEKLSDNLRYPSNIAILDKDDILVAEKKTGVVHRIVNGEVLPDPALDLVVASKGERGLLSITAAKNITKDAVYVFIYYTQATLEDGEDASGYREPLGNRLYQYELVNNKLVNPRMLMDTPVGAPGIDIHSKIIVGPDNNVYLLVNNMEGSTRLGENNNVQEKVIIKPENGQINIIKRAEDAAKQIDETSKIIRVTQDGKILSSSTNAKSNNRTVSNESNTYDVSNLGDGNDIDYDPITENIWLLVDEKISREVNQTGIKTSKIKFVNDLNDTRASMNHVVNVLSWDKKFDPTTLSFVNTSKLGKGFENDLFVGDLNNGNLYHFDLNKNRTALDLNGTLADIAVNNEKEIKPKVLLTGLGRITDIKVADDGYLYFSTIGLSPEDQVKYQTHDGAVYRLKELGK